VKLVKATEVAKCVPVDSVVSNKTAVIIDMAVLKHIEIMSFGSSPTTFIEYHVSGE
jgi:hypothetical protein